jgi:hypothetical protein
MENGTPTTEYTTNNNWNNLDQLQNQYRQHRNERRLVDTPIKKETMAYLIAGHGGETPYNTEKTKEAQAKRNQKQKKTFTVPPGCTIVVHKHPYELSYEFYDMTNKLMLLPKEVINNPVQHKYEIIKTLGSVVFYEAGEECPYFKYTTIDCFPSEQPYTKCYGRIGSGVNNLMTMKDEFDRPNVSIARKLRYKDTTINYDQLDLTQNGINTLKMNEVINIISDMYRFSVYPTRTQISDYITKNFADLTDVVPENANGIAGYQPAMIKSILKGITLQDFVNPTQEFLCKEFPGVYYNFVCRYTEGTKNIDRLNTTLGKSQTTRNTLLYPVSAPKLVRAPAININTNTNTTPVSGHINLSNGENRPYTNPAIPYALQYLNLSKKGTNTRKNRNVNLLKTRILETELKRKKNIKNFYMNPKYVSNKKKALSNVYNEYAQEDEYYRNMGMEMPKNEVNRYIQRFKQYEFLTTFKPASNETNSVYVKQNGKWVKQGGTRKRRRNF